MPAAQVTAAGTLHVVFAYSDGRLPNPWFRAYKRAKRAIRLASYDARVELLPINSVPPSVDVLVMAPELEAEATQFAGAGQRIVSAAEHAPAELDALVVRLVTEGRLGHAPDQARTVAVHRGFVALTERARVAE